jgi:hypothetical protein
VLGQSSEQALSEGGSAEAPLRKKAETDGICERISDASAQRNLKGSLREVWERLSLGIAFVSTNLSKLADLFSSTTPLA